MVVMKKLRRAITNSVPQTRKSFLCGHKDGSQIRSDYNIPFGFASFFDPASDEELDLISKIPVLTAREGKKSTWRKLDSDPLLGLIGSDIMAGLKKARKITDDDVSSLGSNSDYNPESLIYISSKEYSDLIGTQGADPKFIIKDIEFRYKEYIKRTLSYLHGSPATKLAMLLIRRIIQHETPDLAECLIKVSDAKISQNGGSIRNWAFGPELFTWEVMQGAYNTLWNYFQTSTNQQFGLTDLFGAKIELDDDGNETLTIDDNVQAYQEISGLFAEIERNKEANLEDYKNLVTIFNTSLSIYADNILAWNLNLLGRLKDFVDDARSFGMN